MLMKTMLAKNAMLNKKGLNHLVVDINPPKIAAKAEENKKPSYFIFLIDNSGSMDDIITAAGRESSSKIDYAKNACLRFVDMMSDGDKIGVVTFSDYAEKVLPATEIRSENIDEIKRKLRGIHTQGCTNISDSLSTGLGMFTESDIKRYNCKMILLSDGDANRGICSIDGLSSLALTCLERSVTVSSLGVGLQYKANVMGAIANSGGGLFYHIEDMKLLDEIFKEELSHTGNVSMKDVTIQIQIPSLIEFEKNLNDYPQKIEGNVIAVSLGDLFAGRRVAFELKNDFVEEHFVFSVKLSYKDLDGNACEETANVEVKVVKTDDELAKFAENEDVIKYITSVIKNDVMIGSMAHYESGRKDDALQSLRGFSSQINSLSETYSCFASSGAFDGELCEIDSLAEEVSSNKLSQSSAKNMYSASFKERRE